MKWVAAREELDKEVGLAPTRWYAHVSGASWDLLSIGPAPTPEQTTKLEELAKARGLTIRGRAAVEIRQFMSSHTDTRVVGPFTAAEMLKQISEP
jgi:hypothetical protein